MGSRALAMGELPGCRGSPYDKSSRRFGMKPPSNASPRSKSSETLLMSSRLVELLGRVEHSQLITYVFEDKELRFQLYLPETGRLVTFFVPTDTVQGRSISADARRSTGSISLIELAR